MNSENYTPNLVKQHIHDSWNINKSSRYVIDKSLKYYMKQENRGNCILNAKIWYENNKQKKRDYDKMYYLHRKSWGETNGYIINWNLLNISGDVFR